MPALAAPAGTIAPTFAEPVFDVMSRTAVAMPAPAPVDYSKDKRDGRWLSHREIAELVKKAAMPEPTAMMKIDAREAMEIAARQRTVPDQGTTGRMTTLKNCVVM